MVPEQGEGEGEGEGCNGVTEVLLAMPALNYAKNLLSKLPGLIVQKYFIKVAPKSSGPLLLVKVKVKVRIQWCDGGGRFCQDYMIQI